MGFFLEISLFPPSSFPFSPPSYFCLISMMKSDLYSFVHSKRLTVYELQITITRKVNINPTQFNRECCRSDVTLFWTLSWVGVECAGAGASAGYDETFAFFIVTSVKAFEMFLFNTGVMWPTFPIFFDNEPPSRPYPWCFPFLSICFFDPYLSVKSVLWRIGIEVVLVKCNSVINFIEPIEFFYHISHHK